MVFYCAARLTDFQTIIEFPTKKHALLNKNKHMIFIHKALYEVSHIHPKKPHSPNPIFRKYTAIEIRQKKGERLIFKANVFKSARMEPGHEYQP